MHRIREATPADDAELGELMIESFVSTYARKMPEVRVTDSRKADLRDVASKRALGKVLVCESEHGMLLGTVTIYPPGTPGSRDWLGGHSDLRYMAVRPTHFGQGIADALIRAAIDQARAWTARGIILHVRQGATGVAKVYLRHGFQRRSDGDQDLRPEIYLEAYLLQI